jgi:tetratricopeptide (TPR) repeat protein
MDRYWSRSQCQTVPSLGRNWVFKAARGALLLLLLGAIAFGADDTSVFTNARQALDQGDYASAERLYRRALSMNSRSFEALNNVGVALYLQGKRSDAIRYFRMALAQRYDPGTFAFLAVAKCGTRDLDGARSMLDEIRVQKIDDSRVLALIAPCFLESGDPISAIRAYESLRKSGPISDDERLIRLANAYLAALRVFVDRLQKAPQNEVFVRALQQARNSGSVNARVAFPLAMQQSPFLRTNITFSQAADLLTEHPKDASLLYVLAVLSGEQAMDLVLKCEETYGSSPWLEQFRAEMLANQGREEEAKITYEHLVQRRPDLPGLRSDLADLYRKHGDWEKALALFRQEEAASESDEHAAAGVSESLLELGRYSELKSYLEPKIMRKSRVPLWATLDLSSAHQKLGEPGEAIKILVAGEREDPSSKTIHYRLMRLYAQVGEMTSAEREKHLFERSH